jgi:hypothetical protein
MVSVMTKGRGTVPPLPDGIEDGAYGGERRDAFLYFLLAGDL